VDCHVEAEFPLSWYDLHRTFTKDGIVEATPEDVGKRLEKKCKEFEDFLRDHRSQDMVQLNVMREKKDLCSACNGEWEPYQETDGEISCACCGAVLQHEAVVEADEQNRLFRQGRGK
jgi:hypothetical protein